MGFIVRKIVYRCILVKRIVENSCQLSVASKKTGTKCRGVSANSPHRNSMENLAEVYGGLGVNGRGCQIRGRFENRPYSASFFWGSAGVSVVSAG
jgi:hypothetical protein